MDLQALAKRAIVQPIRLPELQHRSVEWSLWRLDQIDAAASGNKLFKLAENFRAARAAGFKRILSFGGAFSNHLHALALLGAAEGFSTIGIVRGEAVDNATLRDAQRAGMLLHFVDRSSYRRKHEAAFLENLQQRFGSCYIIPEGAANSCGMAGCRVLGETIRSAAWHPDLVVLPCATGSTLAGLVAGLDGYCDVLGIAVLKGGEFLRAAVSEHLRIGAANLVGVGATNLGVGATNLGVGATNLGVGATALSTGEVAPNMRWSIDTEQHGGGYARVEPGLANFISDFQQRTGIPLEPVYTGKMLYALYRRIAAGGFAPGTRLLALHTGGLQGVRGFANTDQIAVQHAVDGALAGSAELQTV